MKIGIFLRDFDQSSGGAYTFVFNLLKKINSITCKHQIYIFYRGSLGMSFSDNIITINIDDMLDADKSINREVKNSIADFLVRIKDKIIRFIFGKYLYGKTSSLEERIEILESNFAKITSSSNYNNSLNRAALKNKIDLMWFIVPLYMPVEVPFIFTMWDYAHRDHPCFPEVTISGEWEARENYYNGMLKKAAYVIIGTESGKQALAEYYNLNKERVRVIPFSTPQLKSVPADESARANLIAKKPYILYPAQFWPHKNHTIILKAIKMLSDEYAIKLNVVFCGSDKGNLEYVKEKTKEYSLNDSVYFVGFVSLAELINLYKDAFALVYPTYFGPANLPPLEAMSLGCPVIASDISGAAEQLGDAALLFPPEKESGLAEALLKLINQPDIREALIERGFSQAAKYQSENYIKEIFQIIDEFSAVRQCWSSSYKYVGK